MQMGAGGTMDINGWEVTHGWCNKWGVECANTQCEGENY
jgi:hypothetical protein